MFEVNKNLLPLKVTLFMFSGAGYAVIPYLTIHMKARTLKIGVGFAHNFDQPRASNIDKLLHLSLDSLN